LDSSQNQHEGSAGSQLSGPHQFHEHSDALAVAGVAGVSKRSRRESLGLSVHPSEGVAPMGTAGSQVSSSSSSASNAASPLDQFLSFGMQAAWRLSNWREVEAYLECNLPFDDFQCNVGRCLYYLKHKEQRHFVDHLQRARVEVMGPLLAASQDSYARSFPHLLSLHLLSELETMGLDMMEGKC
jgi:hypothetical protein